MMDRAVLIPLPDVPKDASYGREFDDDIYWKAAFGDDLQRKLALAAPLPGHGHGKVAGWKILAFPIVSSALLWAVIVLGYKFVS